MILNINRREEEEVRKLKGWIMVYGRRKTGKTYMLRKVFRNAQYFMITRAGYIIHEEEREYTYMNVKEAISRVGSLLDNDETVIIDEFQRLPEFLWEEIALHHPNGKLIASGSSLGIISKVFNRRSPLLGLLSPLKLDIISYSDTIMALKNLTKTPKDTVMWGLIFRDPWVIPILSIEADIITETCGKAYYLAASTQGLIGEVFEEEERALTRIYDAILRLVGEGVWKPSEIAGILTSNNMIMGGQSTVTGILERLVNMGLLEKIPLWKTRGARFYFKHRSPIVSIIQYIDQKLNITETPNINVKREIVANVLSREIQFSLGEMMAEYIGGRRAYTILPDGDIDIVILDERGRAPIIGYEVKIGDIEVSEAKKAIERIHKHGIPRAGLISISTKPPKVPGSYEEMGPEEIIEIAGRIRSKQP
ncbi:MAG: AAA family ATPase [archaeon GBS-70-058]|nr:AAA family ATPase [Candidatus Culexarchaeum nevadense]